MATISTNRPNHSSLQGSTTRLVGLIAATAVVLLLVLSMGMTKAGAVDTVTYPPCTTPEDCPQNGDTLVLVGHGYKPGSTVTTRVFYDSDGDGVLEERILTGVADANGDVIFEWDIPAGFAGDVSYVIEGIDENGEVLTESGSVFAEDKTLNPDNGGGGGGPLPYTGSDSTNLVRIGLVLIVAGGISVVAVRRRHAGTNA